VDVFQLALGRLYRLAEQGYSFEGVVQTFAALLEAILKQNLGIGACSAAE
jgi:hypothetical protein